MLLIAGDQVPEMLLVDVVGNAAINAPLQNGPTEAKVGVAFGVIAMVNVVLVAHWPVAGVNVYRVVEVLLIAGFHVPVIPLMDVVGSAGIDAPLQLGPTVENEGVIVGFTTKFTVVCVDVQPPRAEGPTTCNLNA